MGQTARPDWVRVTEQAAWAPRDSCGEMVLDGRMWLMGGWFDSYSVGPLDVWSSTNGADWDLVTAQAPWRHGDLPTSLAFDGRLWMMGGWYAGRLPEGSPGNNVFASADGAAWECVTPAAGWSRRVAAGGAVFRDRMWILGGAEAYFFATDDDLLNDVWSSADGADWTQHAPAPWSPRAYHGAATFHNRLWVLGGGQYLPEYHASSDVWCSDDGESWTCVAAQAPWHDRIWFSTAVYRDCLWVLGGWSSDPYHNWGDAWYTTDGERWHELQTETMWKGRHEHSVFVHDDALWVAGGHAQPLSNEVWCLRLPEDWQPE